MERSHAFIGTELGPCTIVQLLGQGSTGAVFLADHAELREQVAVKVVAPPALPLEPFDLASFLARFRRAASSAFTLAHPHILPVIEYGVQDGLGYLVMPYLDLEPFDAVMSREGPVTPLAAATYLDQLVDALTYAHGLRIHHGNITPRNILLKRGGSLALTDFGQGMVLRSSVRQAGSAAQAARISPYRAPEQLLGGRVDERTDLYALGVFLFELLTGTTPYSGTSASELLMQQLQQPPPSPQEIQPEVSEACALVIVRALAREPSQRFAQVEELAHAFRSAAALAGVQTSARALQVPAPTEKRIDESEQENRLAEATAFRTSAQLAPELLLSPAIPSAPLRLNGQGKDQDTKAPPHLPEGNGSQGTDSERAKREAGGVTTNLVQVFTSAQAAPVLRATPIQSEDDRQQSAPSSPLPSIGRALSARMDLHRITRHTWPIRRRGLAFRQRRKARFLTIGAACLLAVVVAGSLLWGALFVPQTPGARKSALEPLPGQGQVTLFSDALTRASHSQWWPTVPESSYTFTQSAYRITGAGLEGTSAVLVTPLWESGITYSITAQRESSQSSSTFFGILFRCNNLDEEGSPQACYSFEVTGEGSYRFYKYDALTFAERQAGPASEWSLLWQHPIGSEFHDGQGASNTFTVVEGQTFTLLINGKRVGQVADTSFQSGMIGMIVGGPGTVVAFSRLLVTRM